MGRLFIAQPTWKEEQALRRRGLYRVAGIDEAGRGAWAGPVVAAAVVLPEDRSSRRMLKDLRDSKQLSPSARSELYDVVMTVAQGVSVGIIHPERIDAIGILAATREAMLAAIAGLPLEPDALLIDAVPLPLPLPQRVLHHADALCFSVAAASVIAKVTRDRLMMELDALYPAYGFARHKGYGTRYHRLALLRHAPSPVHRLSYAPVQQAAILHR
jgi:ribonuclease HII